MDTHAALSDYTIDWHRYHDAVDVAVCLEATGRIVRVVGLIAEATGLNMSIGSLVKIENDYGDRILAEVVGFRDDHVRLMPYGDTRGIRPGSRVTLVNQSPRAEVGDAFLSRVVDGMGQPIDGGGPIAATAEYPLYGTPINPMNRRTVDEPMDVGLAAINAMVPLGRGQRVAIMAGSGVGKSVLMGMMARHTAADVTIIGLIGERGREVRDFVDQNLGVEGRKRTVVVAATSDAPALVRMRGAYLATTLAEYFRDQGLSVLLIVDSITRFAMSSRDVGLAAGEPPTTRGYTPSFFAQIPVLLERAGAVKGKGSITGIYTVLVEGDDMNDPVGDTVRSIVDGHIVLSRKLANRGHYPAIEVLESVSRVIRDVSLPEQLALREQAIEVLATYRDVEDMIAIGAYTDGTNPAVDRAKKYIEKVNRFLRQGVDEKVDRDRALTRLRGIFSRQ
ncbi:MAG: flagellum-specific ATP synthase FliI [Deltaproteobacteria bacterium]|nr:MAG: flagellum-specific ATP synthase FliI [Deltaproteobacteria bacterium]